MTHQGVDLHVGPTHQRVKVSKRRRFDGSGLTPCKRFCISHAEANATPRRSVLVLPFVRVMTAAAADVGIPSTETFHQIFLAALHRKNAATPTHDEEAGQHVAFIINACKHVALRPCGEATGSDHSMLNDLQSAISKDDAHRPIRVLEVDRERGVCIDKRSTKR